MIETVNPEEEPVGGAESYPLSDTPEEAGDELQPISEPPAEPIAELEPESISGTEVYPIPEPEAESAVETSAELPGYAGTEPVAAQAERQVTEPTPAGEPMPQAAAQPLSPSDERTWAMLAHLSVLANLVTGVLGPFIALIIYLVYRDRSRYVAYQAMQAFIFQLITWVGSGILIGGIWLVTGLLSIVVVGIFLIPFALIGTICLGILPLVGLIYGIVGAIETSQGKDFQYWLVGDWARGLH